jgi:hypothetical protein
MYDQLNACPRRYFVDGAGRRVLIGLSVAETLEFEKLDAAAFESSLASQKDGTQEARWRELYLKHHQAWRVWITPNRGWERSV